MASAIPEEGEWLVSMEEARRESAESVLEMEPLRPLEVRHPVHPLKQLQGPFEESILDAMKKPEQMPFVAPDAASRRQNLLESERYERICAGKWRQRAGEKYHPLWKLSAQLSFGMHLLVHSMAKSDLEVMRILQAHVDEVDMFLERTTDDLEYANNDAKERMQYVKVPLTHGKLFDQMLEDRGFRTEILEANDKIDHIVERSAAFMNDALKDIQKGIEAVEALEYYLKSVAKSWHNWPQNLHAVYVSMLGNVEGWLAAFKILQKKGGNLLLTLFELGKASSELARRIGVASRKRVTQVPSETTRSKSTKSTRGRPPSGRIRSISSASPLSNKPLPHAPGVQGSVAQLAMPKRPDSKQDLKQDLKKRESKSDMKKQSSKQDGSTLRKHTVSNPQIAQAILIRDAPPRRTRSLSETTDRVSRRNSVAGIPQRGNDAPSRPPHSAVTAPESNQQPQTQEQRRTLNPPRTQRPRPRSVSVSQLDQEILQGKSGIKTVWDSLVQFEKRKSLAVAQDEVKSNPSQRRGSDFSRRMSILSPLHSPKDNSRQSFTASLISAGQRPLGLFRAKSSGDLTRQKSEELVRPSSERQSSWPPSQHILYSLKPTPDMSPRLPEPFTFNCSPVRENVDEEAAGQESAAEEKIEASAESGITALPPMAKPDASSEDKSTSEDRPLSDVRSVASDSSDQRKMTARLRSKRSSSKSQGLAGDPAVLEIDHVPELTKIPKRISLADRRSASKPSINTETASIQILVPPPRSAKRNMVPPPRSPKRDLVRSPSSATPPSAPLSQASGNVGGSAKQPASLAPPDRSYLIESLASTPPASPIHDRSPPNPLAKIAAPKNVQNTSSRTRLGLGIKIGLHADPSDFCSPCSPPPPGPGGRSMASRSEEPPMPPFESEKRVRVRKTLSVGKLLPRKKSLRRLFGVGTTDDTPMPPPATISLTGDPDYSSPYVVPDDKATYTYGLSKNGTWVTTQKKR